MEDFVSSGDQWYYITATLSDTVALYGPGSTFFSPGDPTNKLQKWQLFPYKDYGYYVIRNQWLGSAVCIVTFGENAEGGGGAPKMSTITEADESMFWRLSPWGDGTFYMTNARSGTEWHLNVKPSFLMDLTNITTGLRDGQSFNLNAIGDINNTSFSTVNTPPGLSLAAPTTANTITTGSLTASTTSSPSSKSTGTTTLPTAMNTISLPASSSSLAVHHSGLSPAASGGIGAAIATVFLLAVIIIVFLILHCKKKKQFRAFSSRSCEEPKRMGQHELQSNGHQISQELDVQTPEMPGGCVEAWEMSIDTR